MKIMYISGSHIPSKTANSLHVVKMADAMVERGHKLILCHYKVDSKNNSNAEYIKHFYALKNNFQFIQFSQDGIFGKYVYALKAVKFSMAEKVDLIFCRSIPGFLCALFFFRPCILEVHAPLQGKMAWLVKIGLHLPWAKRLVVITEKLKEHMASDCLIRPVVKKIIVAADAVNVDAFDSVSVDENLRKSLNIPEGKTLAGYSGHLYKGKGGDLIVDVAERISTVTFLIVGGEEADVRRYKALCKNKGIDNIIWLGFKPQNELPQYIKICDLLLLPNQAVVQSSSGNLDIGSWTSPLKMFEYMAAAKPIIASDLPVLREILNKDNAKLCSPTDVTAWVGAIQDYSRPELRDEFLMRATQAQRDVKNYTWEKRADYCLEGI